MFVIRNWLLLLFFALSVAAVLFLGFYGYSTLGPEGVAPVADVKYHSEQLAYISLVSAAVLILAMMAILIKSLRLFRELDKLAELTQYGRYQTGEYLGRLGRLGVKLQVLFHNLSALNEMKTLKISAMANLGAFLIDNMEMRLIVADADGRVAQCSKRLLIDQNMEKRDLLGRKLGELIEGVNLSELCKELERTRKAATFKSPGAEGMIKYKGDYIFYPVFNSAGSLVNIVCIMERDMEADEISRRTEQIKADEGKRGGIVRFIKDRIKR